MEYNWQWYRVDRYIYRIVDGEFIFGPLLRGLGVTLEMAVWSVFLSIAIGMVTALLRLSNSASGRFLATVYLEAIRNTPLLVQLFLFYYVLAPILEIDRFWAGVLCLSFFEGSFASEIIRAGPPVGSQGAVRRLGRSWIYQTRPPAFHLTAASDTPDPSTDDRTADIAHSSIPQSSV